MQPIYTTALAGSLRMKRTQYLDPLAREAAVNMQSSLWDQHGWYNVFCDLSYWLKRRTNIFLTMNF